MPGSTKKTATTSRNARDRAQNMRASGAPFGRYEDMSAKRASSASNAAKKRAGAEGPKKSSPRPGGIGKGGGKGAPGNKRGR